MKCKERLLDSKRNSFASFRREDIRPIRSKEMSKYTKTVNSRPQLNVHFDVLCREELDEVREEILSLSEKYSIKCVEAASLEEKCRIATHQLKHFQQHVQQLETRY